MCVRACACVCVLLVRVETDGHYVKNPQEWYQTVEDFLLGMDRVRRARLRPIAVIHPSAHARWRADQGEDMLVQDPEFIDNLLELFRVGSCMGLACVHVCG